ncbi:MAG: hypothetical protein ACXQTI_08040 [Candidatus Nezhaarchaeales archaeon]
MESEDGMMPSGKEKKDLEEDACPCLRILNVITKFIEERKRKKTIKL